ncbi:MAG: hypothetical protein K6G80_05480 [Treponema sp.]|nr:hypothetical protein [Treponema sp.]
MAVQTQASGQVHRVQAGISQSRSASLREGAVVQARVLSHDGGSSYTVSIAGRKLQVRSEQPMTAGQVFSARIQLKGEEIALVLQSTADALPPERQLQALLSSLGLPENTEAFRLVHFAQALGIRLKPEQLRKAYALSLRFSDSEAAELCLILDDKGLESSDEAVQSVLDGRGENSRRQKRRQESEDSGADQQDKERRGSRNCYRQSSGKGSKQGGNDRDFPPPAEAELVPDVQPSLPAEASGELTGDFVCQGILSNPEQFVSEYVSSADASSSLNAPGAMTVCNQIARKRNVEDAHRHLIQLPFVWDYAGYEGVILLLWDADSKKLCRITIHMQNHMEKKHFVVYYYNQRISRIAFSEEPALLPAERKRYAKGLSAILERCIGQPVTVEYDEACI